MTWPPFSLLSVIEPAERDELDDDMDDEERGGEHGKEPLMQIALDIWPLLLLLAADKDDNDDEDEAGMADEGEHDLPGSSDRVVLGLNEAGEWPRGLIVLLLLVVAVFAVLMRLSIEKPDEAFLVGAKAARR